MNLYLLLALAFGAMTADAPVARPLAASSPMIVMNT